MKPKMYAAPENGDQVELWKRGRAPKQEQEGNRSHWVKVNDRRYFLSDLSTALCIGKIDQEAESGQPQWSVGYAKTTSEAQIVHVHCFSFSTFQDAVLAAELMFPHIAQYVASIPDSRPLAFVDEIERKYGNPEVIDILAEKQDD